MKERSFALFLICLLSSIILWLPFVVKVDSFWGLRFNKQGLEVVYKNYDGPMYLTVAKSFYNPDLIALHNTTSLSPIYFAAHFPMYPIFIRISEIFFGTLRSLTIVTTLFSILSVLMFFKFVTEFKLSKNPFFLSVLFLFLPARWLIVRGVGSNEPVFMFFFLASFYFFKRALNSEKWADYLFAGIMGAFAQLTRSPGIILFIAYLIYLIWLRFKEKKNISYGALSIILIPLSLVLLFAWYGMSYHDFFAYFHSGDNLHLEMLPFGVFNSDKAWVGMHWLEDNIYVYLLGVIGILILYKKRLFDLFSFAAAYFIATLFVAHRDIARYSLPIVPFVLIAFEDFLTKKEFKIAFLFILVPIYLFAWNFILHNQAPIADWGPYL